MTVEEKRKEIERWCESNGDDYKCHECPLFELSDDSCYQEVTTEQIERHYKLLVKAGYLNDNSGMVDHPSHYNQGDIECIDAMVAAFGKEYVSMFCVINAFKYIWRAKHKNGTEDIDKAIWYLTKYLELKEEA